jgi:hypothetical protein
MFSQFVLTNYEKHDDSYIQWMNVCRDIKTLNKMLTLLRLTKTEIFAKMEKFKKLELLLNCFLFLIIFKFYMARAILS